MKHDYARGSGRTTVMLRCVLGAARCGERVLVVMLNDFGCDLARDSLKGLADTSPLRADDEALSRITFTTVAEELQGAFRGRTFDIRYVDHAVHDSHQECRECTLCFATPTGMSSTGTSSRPTSGTRSS